MDVKISWLNKVKDICMDNDSAITDMCRSQDLYIKKQDRLEDMAYTLNDLP